MTFHRSSLLKAAVATLMFGSIPACVRLTPIDSYALGFWRLLLSTVGMTAILRYQGRSFSALVNDVRRNWRVLAAVGLCFGLHWLTYFQSIKLGNASIGALGFSTFSVQLPILGWLLGFGRPRVIAMAGVVLAMGGSLLCIPPGESSDQFGLAMAIGILSGTLYAVLPLLHQRHAHLDHELRTWAQFALALPVFIATAPLADWSLRASDIWTLVYLGAVVTLIGHLVWVQLTTELPLAVTGALNYLQLPTILAFNYMLADEKITAGMLVGAACIIAGNVLALVGAGRRVQRELAEMPGDA